MVRWSLFIHKINHTMEEFINKQAKVKNFITVTRWWNLTNINNILPDYGIDKTKTMYILITDIEDKLI